MIYIENIFVSFCDHPEFWQFGMQPEATPAMASIIAFHNYILFFIILICLFVFWILYTIIIKFTSSSNPRPSKVTHSSILEIIWTLIPAIILLLIAIPSFALLYGLDELTDPQMTLKVVGHQWYWSYELHRPKEVFVSTDIKELIDKNLNFDSYMVPDSDLVKGSFRLLEVDNRVVLPTNTHIRLLVTSSDVIHSWAVPSFGVKIDAVPGRVSQASLFIKREGVFYGQCSEICGVNHAFMPIVVRSVEPRIYDTWLDLKLGLVERKSSKFVKLMEEIENDRKEKALAEYRRVNRDKLTYREAIEEKLKERKLAQYECFPIELDFRDSLLALGEKGEKILKHLYEKKALHPGIILPEKITKPLIDNVQNSSLEEPNRHKEEFVGNSKENTENNDFSMSITLHKYSQGEESIRPEIKNDRYEISNIDEKDK